MKRLVLACLCLATTAGLGLGQTPEEKKQTIAALKSLQARDGGFLPAPQHNDQVRSSLRATLGAMRALKYFGGDLPNKTACADFVRSCYDTGTGGFTDHPGGQPDVGTTSVGIMAVVELNMPVKDYREHAIAYLGKHVQTFEDIRIAAAAFESLHELPPQRDAWLEQIAKLRNADGTYGKNTGQTRATGGAVAAVLRLGGKVEHREQVIKALKAGQRSDGGFGREGAPGSDLDSSYRIMRAFAMLKEKPDVERFRAFIARCRNADGLYGVSPGKQSQVGSTYNASIILHWLSD